MVEGGSHMKEGLRIGWTPGNEPETSAEAQTLGE